MCPHLLPTISVLRASRVNVRSRCACARTRAMSRRLACLVLLVACSRTVPAPPPSVEKADVVRMSQSFLTAYARMDEAAFTSRLAPAFVFFEDGHVDERSTVLEGLRARKKRAATPRTLEWRDDRVVVAGGTATFLGDVVERTESDASQPTRLQGWNTLVWGWNGASWEVVYWQWQQGGAEGERNLWNAEFRSGAGFSAKPNRLLIEVAGAHPPGTALDLGMGQGRNAIDLAARGWKVTGIDISDVGVAMARDTAAKRQLSLEAINADVTGWDFGQEKWDLVTLLYFRPDDRDLRRIGPSLRRGGLVVVEGFHKPRAQNWQAGELAALFKDGFEILRDEVVDDVPDWGTHPEKLVRFVARRRS
jgi:SAM-dependent methyltransferase